MTWVLERNGVFLRAQVKSTIHRVGGSYVCALRPTLTNPYNAQEIELLSAYIAPEDLWYTLPVSVVTPLVGNIWLSQHIRGSKHDGFKEAWHLLLERTKRVQRRARSRKSVRRGHRVRAGTRR